WPWPGNIRELRNVIERAVALGAGPVIQMSDLPSSLRAGCPITPIQVSLSAPTHSPAPEPTDEIEDCDELSRIFAALRKHRNNRLRAAIELGMSRVSLYKKLKKYGIENKLKLRNYG